MDSINANLKCQHIWRGFSPKGKINRKFPVSFPHDPRQNFDFDTRKGKKIDNKTERTTFPLIEGNK